ncbi:MAG: bacterioferritin [Acidobacteria bacterium]|nr:bacterioferritin [Acidobacteriota bacterium]MCB9398939.1 bacterioferritin [Acidobacteriota bacterium]
MNQDVKDQAVNILNQILECELAGAVCYTHYGFMVFGYNRIPIVSWLNSQADENLAHARKAGEMITHFGGHPSLGIGKLLESHKHDIGQILVECMETENRTLLLYKDLLKLSEGHSVLLEEYAREMIYQEELHIGEIDKMMRKPGDIHVAEPIANLKK